MQLDLELYREELTLPSGINLSFIEIAPEAPQHTLIFIHGFGGHARQWEYQLQQFGDRNHVIAPDLRGHGRSGRPAQGYDMEAILSDLDGLLGARAPGEHVVLIGHSFGGAIITDFALRHPERVERLVLIASAADYHLVWPYQLAFRLPAELLRALQPLVGRFVEAYIPALRRMFHQSVKRWQGAEKFRRLSLPVLVLRGERDRVFPQAVFTQVAAAIPDAQDVNVGASAHMVMLERREAVNRAIERFVDDSAAAPRWRRHAASPGRASLPAERPWLLHYESGVPHTLDIPSLPLTRLLDRAWRRFPRRPALVFHGRTLTYRTLSAQAGRFANALGSLGVAKGARVMILLPNIPHFVIAYYGALRVGAIVVMSNPLASREEIVRQAQDSGAELLVTLERFRETARAVRAQSEVRHVVFGSMGDYLPLLQALLYRWRRRSDGATHDAHEWTWRNWLRSHDVAPPRVKLAPEETAVIQYTGGTVARPKGVALSHRNLVANALQTRAWMPNAEDGQETILCVIPFSHVYGMTTAMNLAVASGASMILLPRFETAEVLAQIRRQRPSLFPGVPSMYMAINSFPGVRRYDVESIQACLSGAAPLPVEVKEAFEKLTKGRLVEGYGLSEASPVTHANPIFGRDRTGSIGLPLPSTEARVVDLRTDIPLPVPVGQFGELVVRGPQIMQGYWQDQAATRAVLDEDGWLRTGDIARMDEDGYFQIISRRQDMWQAAGASPAFPRDVEEVIYELPEVREVVVVAVANRPVAFVQLKDDASVPAKTIIAYARRHLPPEQTPRHLIFVKEFPRSFIGKVLRRELVSQYRHQLEPGAGSVGEHLAGLEDDA